MTGEPDVAQLAKKIPRDLLFDWWAFGLLRGWFPQWESASKWMTPEQAAELEVQAWRQQRSTR